MLHNKIEDMLHLNRICMGDHEYSYTVRHNIGQIYTGNFPCINQLSHQILSFVGNL